jgi:hypothetical protein
LSVPAHTLFPRRIAFFYEARYFVTMSAIAERIDRRLSQLPPQRAERLEYLLIGLLEYVEPETPAMPAVDDAQQSRARGKSALSRIAARGGITSISDPAAWQREQRTDRPLPGRVS